MLSKFINANNIPYVPSRFLDYDDVGIIPYQSQLTGKDDSSLDLSSRFGSYDIRIPVVYKGLSGTTDFSTIKNCKTIGFINSRKITSVTELITILSEMGKYIPPSFEIGTHPNDIDIISSVLQAGIKKPQILISGDNGESRFLLEQVRRVKAKYLNDVDISVGYPQTIQSATESIRLGANNIVINNSDSITEIPAISKIINIRHALFSAKSNATMSVVLDDPNNAVKAMVAGADTVMLNFTDTNIDLIKQEVYLSGATKISDLFNRVAFFEVPK